MQHNMFVKLVLMAALSFVAMYLLMYTMIDTGSDFYPSIGMAWMGHF